jgi:hypothetical protein
MWRANYTYRPVYAVYAKGVGHGMVNYMAKVHIPSCLCDLGYELECDVWGKGITSINMAIQVASYYAITMLRKELYILSKLSFQHFPQKDRDERSVPIHDFDGAQYSL